MALERRRKILVGDPAAVISRIRVASFLGIASDSADEVELDDVYATVPVTGSKIVRAEPVAAQARVGNIGMRSLIQTVRGYNRAEGSYVHTHRRRVG